MHLPCINSLASIEDDVVPSGIDDARDGTLNMIFNVIVVTSWMTLLMVK